MAAWWRRRTELLRRLRTYCASIVLVCAGWVIGHGTSVPHDLAGVRPCVDDDSIDVRFERGGEAARRAVTERLERSLRTVFDAAAMPWSRMTRCDDESAYLSLVLHVWEASDFAPRASAYELAVQVGPRTTLPDGSARARPPEAFDLAFTELFDERAVGVAAVVFLPRYVEAGLRDLTVSWWEDHLEAAAVAAVPIWLPWLGAALAVLAALSAWRFSPGLRRRSGAEQPIRHRAECQHGEGSCPDQADPER